MRCLKNVFKVMGIVGFMIVMGAVGNADYKESIGAYCSMSELIYPIIFGIAFMMPALTIMMGGAKCE